MSNERMFMTMAVEEAIKCPSIPALGNPKVGAVLVTRQGTVYRSHRGEFPGHPDDHAEFNLLINKVPREELEGCDIYTTLEPCTDRRPDKVPCFERVIAAKPSRVFIALQDTSPGFSHGRLFIEEAGIEVRSFDPDLRDKLDRLNRGFTYLHRSGIKNREKNKGSSDPLRFKALNRDILAAHGKQLHASVDELPNFPLIGKASWIPNRLVAIREVDAKVSRLPETDYKPSMPTIPTTPGMVGSNRTFAEYVLEMQSDTRLDPNNAFRLMRVTYSADVPKFEFGGCNYLDFFNTLEGAAFELAAVVAGKNGGDAKLGLGDLPVRASFGDITCDFQSRYATVGVNTLLVVKNGPSGRHEFFLHDRTHYGNADSSVAEAQNVFHVVPAGLYQSDEDVLLDPMSIGRTVLREYAEELVSEKKVEREIEEGRDFLSLDELKPLVKSIASETSSIWYMGWGLDPVTTKPELLCLLVLDAKALDIESYDDFFNEGWEGKLFPVIWSLENLRNWAEEARMLPAGAACLLAAKQHFAAISKLLESSS